MVLVTVTNSIFLEDVTVGFCANILEVIFTRSGPGVVRMLEPRCGALHDA